MFDLGISGPPSVGSVPSARSVLEPGLIERAQRALTAALQGPSGLDDVGRVEAIRALERLGCVVSAAQALLSVELDASRREDHAARGLPAARHGQGVAHEIALARRESPHRGQRDLGLAKVVLGELPATWHAWSHGHLGQWPVTLIARETACLSRDHRAAVDQVVAGDPEHLEQLSLRGLVGRLHTEAVRLDPASVVARRRQAEADRHVTLRPAPDTMTWLTALLPVTEGVAAYAALTRAADTTRAVGDPRSKGQVMADALVARVLDGGATDGQTLRTTTPVSLGLVITDHALFGHSDRPAHLEGHGPVPAELAREIVAGALTAGERVWLRRLYTHPDTGELVAMDAHSRLFRGTLARFIRLRDQTCRTPWCEAPIRHLDHALPHALDGPTTGPNAQGLCEACNHAKRAPGWRARPSPDTHTHEIETTLPTGHHYRTRPPRLVG